MARILLADDEPASHDLMRRALQSDGHVITVADCGNDALKRLEADPAGYECLITDVNMPGLDGIELIRHAVGLSPTLALVLISGYVDQLDRAKALWPDRLLTLAKPFTLEQIRVTAKTALESAPAS